LREKSKRNDKCMTIYPINDIKLSEHWDQIFMTIGQTSEHPNRLSFRLAIVWLNRYYRNTFTFKHFIYFSKQIKINWVWCKSIWITINCFFIYAMICSIKYVIIVNLILLIKTFYKYIIKTSKVLKNLNKNV